MANTDPPAAAEATPPPPAMPAPTPPVIATAAPADAPPRARSFPWFAYALVALLGLAVAGAGLALMFWYAPPVDLGTVSEVRITMKPGIDLSKVKDVLDTPDYYVEVRTAQGGLRTETVKDTPVGNGLTFKLPVPMRLVDITEVKIWDEDVRKGSLVDRIDKPARDVAGERFTFSLIGQLPPPTPTRRIALALAC